MRFCARRAACVAPELTSAGFVPAGLLAFRALHLREFLQASFRHVAA
ncbi:hypothetical protein ALO75_102408 [Pseudomonas syringae pv. coryli]|uniref:Uncharacterized protein n=1 Tax=Pseudomonas syringae pv. coryli TaxID=317659 RepID=A0A0N8R4X6_9PSED|nr:hypothetical protein ALO75_102408 [Pseudomonas syringae pv. coryli]